MEGERRDGKEGSGGVYVIAISSHTHLLFPPTKNIISSMFNLLYL